jgi:hypothetical protein
VSLQLLSQERQIVKLKIRLMILSLKTRAKEALQISSLVLVTSCILEIINAADLTHDVTYIV